MILLAQDEAALHAWGELVVRLVPMIIVLGLLGAGVIMGLLIAWRRHHRRQQQREAGALEPTAAREHADAWEAAGQRMQVMPNPGRPRRSADDDAERYEDDEEEDAPWRESLGDIPEFESEYDKGRDDSDEPDEDWDAEDDDDDADDDPPWSR